MAVSRYLTAHVVEFRQVYMQVYYLIGLIPNRGEKWYSQGPGLVTQCRILVVG